MSASHWDVCPRCFDEAKRKHDEEAKNVYAQYGIVSVDEFDAMRDALQHPVRADYTTFREDYEFFGAETGILMSSYRGVCRVCGLSLEFETNHQFYPV